MSSLTAAEEQQIEAELARLEPAPKFADPLANVVIVDGLPVVPAAKVEKLTTVLRKLFQGVGAVVDLQLTLDESGGTTGFGFVEYENAEFAAAAVKQLNNHPLDKTHTLLLNAFSDFDKFESLATKFEEPKSLELQTVENLREWLEDARALDQYVIRYADRTEVYWNEQKGSQKAELVYSRDNWTESFVQWSPLGTYLVTIHRQGVAFWGGPSWKRIVRLMHPNVETIEFSPCEKYVVTFAPVDNDDPADPRAIVIWDVRTGRKLRGFVAGSTPFRWSHDDKYFGRLGENVISIYETPSMNLHNKESLKVPGVSDFAWSPTQNVFAYFVPEEGTRAARAAVVEWPSRNILRQKNLFSVSEASLHWQSNGTYLCVKVAYSVKAKKTLMTNFEIFKMREKDIPVDTLEMSDRIVAFAWEPKGKRMCIIHGDGSRPDVSFYTVEKKGVVFANKLDKRPANAIFWSPRGRHVVLAGLRTLNGQFEFYNAADMETMATDEHFMASTVDWDPTGRFVTTVVSAWRQQLETGMNLYTFAGNKVHSVLRDQFFQLLWRPRPPSLLTPARLQHIDANLDSYIASLRESDAKAAEAVKIADRAKRSAVRAALNDAIEAARQQHAAAAAKRTAVFGFDPDVAKPELVRVERLKETVVDVHEEILQ